MSPLIVALDFADPKQALAFTQRLGDKRCYIKIGKELFTRAGPAFVAELVNQNFKVFLDLKFHDIPNTVARACSAAADLGVWMLNVHISGGRSMLLAAREAIDKSSSRPLLIGVTILTSLEQTDLYGIGLHGSIVENVLRLARLANTCDLDGIVCSPLEIIPVRQALGNQLQLVTPGIRLANEPSHDQKRTMTPLEALQLGANYLVIGRSITTAPNPLQTLLEIETAIASN
jgi:orotidine-5'-phosphate decarboxylase